MFKLINYLDKLELIEESNTQFTFRCPVCGGDSLKLSKEKGAYCCFSNECSPKKIRKKLGYQNKNLNYNSDLIPKISSGKLVSEPDFDLQKDVSYFKIENYKIAKKTKRSKDIKTKYHYNDDCLVERIDKNYRKECYPKYKNNGIWTYGSSNKFGFYNDKYLKNLNKEGTIIIVEGEKTADVLTAHSGYLALSPPGFGWNREYIINWYLQNTEFVKNVIIFPDNDQTGINKSNLLKYVFWGLDVPCKDIKLNNFFEMVVGDDIVDLIESNVNIQQVLENIYKYV